MKAVIKSSLLAVIAGLMLMSPVLKAEAAPTASYPYHHRHHHYTQVAWSAWRLGNAATSMQQQIAAVTGETELTHRLTRLAQHAYELQQVAERREGGRDLRYYFEKVDRNYHRAKDMYRYSVEGRGYSYVEQQFQAARNEFHTLRDLIERR